MFFCIDRDIYSNNITAFVINGFEYLFTDVRSEDEWFLKADNYILIMRMNKSTLRQINSG